MNIHSQGRFVLTLGLLIHFSIPTGPLCAEGIPEPSLVLYGTIRNAGDNNIRMIAGTITWQFRNTNSGRTVTLSTRLTNVLDQFSYVLQVPCETFVSGTQISSNALSLTPTAANFDRGMVSLGTNKVSFVVPALANSSISSTNRGRLERVDLVVNIPIIDVDGNGLPDDWETRFFGFVGVDPNGDDDGDGIGNKNEYRAGTDPTDASSQFRFIEYARHPSGGFQVQWASAEGRFYVLQRSSDLLTPFSTIRTNISATPPANTYLDATASGNGPYFYRLRLE